jgi:hypothetical protein
MTRLLLCTATILALTVSANAQALIIGGGNSPSTHAAGVTRGHYPGSYPTGRVCSRVTANEGCVPVSQQPARPQRIKQPRR